MNNAAEVLKTKLLMQGEQIKFLEYVWSCLHDEEKDFYRNNFKARMPHKYTGN